MSPAVLILVVFPLNRTASGLHPPARQPPESDRRFMSDSVMRLRRCVLLMVPMVAWMAGPAHAQWVIAPYLGGNIAGDVESGKGGPGVSLDYLGPRLGFEFDFQRYQHFFKDSEVHPLDPAAPPNCIPGIVGPCADINTDAMSFMGNVVVPIGTALKWRPYGTAGLGLIHGWTNERTDRSQNDFAFNVGGGLTYSLSTHVGVRGDLRYFRAFADEDKPNGVLFTDYGFWRAALGLALRFP